MADSGPCNCDQALALQERIATLELVVRSLAMLLQEAGERPQAYSHSYRLAAEEGFKHVTCIQCDGDCTGGSFILNEKPLEPYCRGCRQSS